MSRQRKNKKQSRSRSRQSNSSFDLQMLEPRLFLSTTVMYQEGGTGSYTPTTFDDCQITQNSDASGNSWDAGVTNASGAKKYSLLAVKDLFTLLPQTSGGNAINITSAQLILTTYNATTTNTLYVDRMASNWLANAAGSNETNVSYKHKLLLPTPTVWAGGGDISASDYTTTNEASVLWATSNNTNTVDITAMLKDIYSTGINDGFLIRSSTTGGGDYYYTSEYGTQASRPVLQITYDYGSTVTLAATTPNAYEPSPNSNGVFTVTRTGSTTSALPVNYTIGGNGVNGTDYTTLSGTVTIPSGQSSTTITVAPINKTIAATDETVSLSLASGTGYTIGAQNSGTVTIFDNASTTISLRQVGGGIYTATNFDDTQLNAGGDTAGNSWRTVLGAGKFGLMAVKDLFTKLPQTQGGNTITITSASLVLTRYNSGSTSDTITVDRVTSNWLPAAAGSNQANVTDVHETLPSQVWPGNGKGQFDWQNYTTVDQGSAPFVSSGACTIDITALMRDIYSTGTNYGFAIFTSAPGLNTDNYYTSAYSSSQPVLQITYTYGSTVDIVATQPNAAEPSVTGTYTVTRGGSTANDMTVNYTVNGTATNGTDYNTLPGSVTIPSGQASATITLTPKGTSFSGSKTAVLTLASGAYSSANPTNATVNIAGTSSYGITGISGTVNVNQPITISGNGFGSGPSDVVFDNFDGGVVGTPILSGPGSAEVGTWNNINSGGGQTYSADSSVSGKQAFKGDYSNTFVPGVYRNFAAGTSQIYATWWLQMPSVYPGLAASGCSWKHVWILGANQSTTVDDMFLGIGSGTSHDVNDITLSMAHNCIGASGTVPTGWGVGNGDFQSGDWVRLSLYAVGSTTAGTLIYTMTNPRTGRTYTTTVLPADNKPTWAGGSPDQWGAIGFNAWATQTSGSVGMFDDTYSADGANARAHVEIGNSSTYATCTNLSIVPTTSWANGSITALANFGSLDTTGPLYLYVTKSDGTVSPPYPVTVSQAPLANNDNYSVSTNGVLTKTAATGVIANDVDLQHNTMTATKVAGPSHGSVTFNSDGSFTYTPTANYYGPDTFTYTDSDGTHTSNTATVTIDVRQLFVDFGGTSDTFGTSWNNPSDVFMNQYVTRSAHGPGGLLAQSYGMDSFAGIKDANARTFNVGETVFVTWYNDSAATITFTPQISFTDPDGDGDGTSGTWYNMTPVGMPAGAQVIIGAGQSVTSFYTIDAGSAGSHTLINVCNVSNNLTGLMFDKIEIG